MPEDASQPATTTKSSAQSSGELSQSQEQSVKAASTAPTDPEGPQHTSPIEQSNFATPQNTVQAPLQATSPATAQEQAQKRAEATQQQEAKPIQSQTSGGSGNNDQFLRRFVVITATMVASVIALGIIFVTALMPFYSPQNAPEELVNWGGIIIGFYFGTFASLLKDWLSSDKTTGDSK